MTEKKKILGIVCERSVNLNKHLLGNRLKDKNNVIVVSMPCSGMIQPAMLEAGFKAGAEGVFVMGCQIGDCHFREGNKWCQDRLLGLRPPNIKKTVDKNRVRGLWLSQVDYKKFLEKVEKFEKELEKLPKEQTEKPTSPAAKV
ncbi:MAG: hydrogenase iron-sulfur subunit [Candidatus Melainabacteria bacterium]|nr:hydrogenase iron-sulfur subunit [Candidatus Melainabacteria bacterium]MBI3309454.1 hydrogenase iron-sulfur subunit [Candidatus Melainabacteria bacterium]